MKSYLDQPNDMTSGAPEISIRSYDPRILRVRPDFIEAVSLCYSRVFSPDESGFEADHHEPENVAVRLLEQTGVYADRDPHSHLIIATTKYDKTVHSPEDGYLPVVIEGAPHAIIGFLWTIGESNKTTIKQTVKETATLFETQEVAGKISANVDEAFTHLTEPQMSETLYVAELGLRKAYRQGYIGLQIIAELAKSMMDVPKRMYKEFMIWTDTTSPMYKLMKSKLGGKDVFELNQNRFLMMGNCELADRNLSIFKQS